MIKNKIITIEKENVFDKGWRLFRPYTFSVIKNNHYESLIASDIVRKITKCDSVNLIIASACLSYSILRELEWANKYIDINIVAKSKNIVEKYTSLKFNNVVIDSSIDFNYIGVHGKESIYAIIDDNYNAIDDVIERQYFNNDKVTTAYSFLDNAREIILIDAMSKNKYNDILEYSISHKIKTYYAIDAKYFTKKVRDKYYKSSVQLLVGNVNNDGIVYVDNDGLLYCAHLLSNGSIVSMEIESISSYIVGVYSCCNYEEVLELKNIKEKLYICDGQVVDFKIKDKIKLEYNVDYEDMKAFIDEDFDRSIVENHNNYSAETKRVEYSFTLIPPLFDKTYEESNIYDYIHMLLNEWKECQHIDFNTLTTRYNALIDDAYMQELSDKIKEFSKWFEKAVAKCEYKNYYKVIGTILGLYQEANDGLLGLCEKLFDNIEVATSSSKFDKFDEEIAGYQYTIEDKQREIAQGKNVLQNKRRIEILSEKINKLLALKSGFEGTSSDRKGKALTQFLEQCEQILNGTYATKTDVDTIDNVIQKEETKEMMLDRFIKNDLVPFRNYLVKCIDLLRKLETMDIPEEYKVYDKNSKHYIVIDDISEYNATQELRAKYNCDCLARR